MQVLGVMKDTMLLSIVNDDDVTLSETYNGKDLTNVNVLTTMQLVTRTVHKMGVHKLCLTFGKNLKLGTTAK